MLLIFNKFKAQRTPIIKYRYVDSNDYIINASNLQGGVGAM